MARSEHSIRMDFKRTMDQASKLEELGKKVEQLAKKDLANSRSNLSGNWKGENATAYLKKVQVVEGNLSSVGARLKNTAGVLRDIAKRTYDAEMRALERARRREH